MNTQLADKHLKMDHFARDVQTIILKAQDLADERKNADVSQYHLLFSALENEHVIKTFKTMNLKIESIKALVSSALNEIGQSNKEVESLFSTGMQRMFDALEKDSSASDLIQIERFMSALLAKSYHTKGNHAIFQHTKIDVSEFCAHLQTSRKGNFSQMSGEELLKMEEEIGKRVIGQREAISAVSRVVKRSFAGLSEPNKPLASLLMMGPSGVGKTELAKALACFLYGSEKKMLRYDMAEFGQQHQVSRFLGSPKGYVGSESGGQLTNDVRDNPHSIILLDEVEKSHQSIWDIFLSVFDNGRLTSSTGELVDFSNTIIIMTSNIGSREILNFTENHHGNNNEDNDEELKEMLLHKMLQYLKPELINRLDETIVFTSLNKMEISQVVDIQLHSLAKLLEAKNMTIEFDREVRDAISTVGYDPMFGARPLKRVITKYIRDPLADKIITSCYQSGDTIRVGYDGQGFTLN